MKATIFYLFTLTILQTQSVYAQNICTICEGLKKNVVIIQTKFNDGSDENGFGIITGEESDKLYIATAKHVIYDLDGNGFISQAKKPRSVSISFFPRPNRTHPARLLLLPDTSLDITLLEVKKPRNHSWDKDFYSNAVQRGTRVWFIGRDRDWYIPTGSFVGSVNQISARNEILIDITSVRPGTSGAPLISPDGIVGLIFADAASGARAYPIEKVRKLVSERWRYPWQMNLNTVVTPIPASEITFACSIAGKVFDEENNQPLPGVQIGLLKYEEGAKMKSSKEVKRWAATTGPDGSFKVECKDIADSLFPLRITLWRPDWGARHLTHEKVDLRDTRTGINISIKPSKKNPPPVFQPIAQGPVGVVIRIELNGNSRSYDFRTGVTSYVNTGDFYFSPDRASFLANNMGQRGLVDLGQIQDRLDRIIPPASGYNRFGVDAVIGHVYVALAREGYENHHIIFRVLDIGLNNNKVQYYRIQYYYRRN